MDSLSFVHAFHTKFGLPINNEPTIPDTAYQRVMLLQEELNELESAITNRDMAKIADALADLQVVLDGAFLTFGLWLAKPPIFMEAHNANMTKMDRQEVVEERTADEERLNLPLRTRVEEVVLKNEYGKVLKGNQYKPPVFENVLDMLYPTWRNVK